MAQTKEENVTILILGDLIADINMRLPKFPVQARDIHRLSYMEVGPGGACNIAIMAARFGLQVSAVGEVGDDGFGLLVPERRSQVWWWIGPANLLISVMPAVCNSAPGQKNGLLWCKKRRLYLPMG